MSPLFKEIIDQETTKLMIFLLKKICLTIKLLVTYFKLKENIFESTKNMVNI